ncbi:MAG TPA: hypothetical protein DCY26_05355 [Hyphomonas sp.]|nr:hypothetical protein [Hyphomonas sp.]
MRRSGSSQIFSTRNSTTIQSPAQKFRNSIHPGKKHVTEESRTIGLTGLMQSPPLQIIDIMKYAANAHGSVEVVSRLVDEPEARSTYALELKRAERAAKALMALGVKPADRVATLAWNTHRHFELFYAVPGIGAVLKPSIHACSTSRSYSS